MIKKYWNKDGLKGDPTFEKISIKIWNFLIHDCETSYLEDTDRWEQKFHCKPIAGDNGYILGLIFENEAEYMLFLLEWL